MEENMLENMEAHVNVEAPTRSTVMHRIQKVGEREEQIKIKQHFNIIESGVHGREDLTLMEMANPPLVRSLGILDFERTVKANVTTEPSFTMPSVLYTGTAEQGELGKSIGHVDIGVSATAYFFRLSLPGVNPGNVKCIVESSGKITVEGATETGEWCTARDHHIFFMETQNLPPSGDFKISFLLPGPVDKGSWSGTIKCGLLEGVVTKNVV